MLTQVSDNVKCSKQGEQGKVSNMSNVLKYGSW